jgi:hypothetical protein
MVCEIYQHFKKEISKTKHRGFINQERILKPFVIIKVKCNLLKGEKLGWDIAQ